MAALATYSLFDGPLLSDAQADENVDKLSESEQLQRLDEASRASRVRMMYWTMRNHELANPNENTSSPFTTSTTSSFSSKLDQPLRYEAGGAEEGVWHRPAHHHHLHPRPLRRSDDESGEENLVGDYGVGEELATVEDGCARLLVVPSLHPYGPTAHLLDYIAGLRYYEERQLYHVFLLRKRDPLFRVIFVSSIDVPREVIAYYFRLMRSTGSFSDEDEAGWWQRLVLLPLRDSSGLPLTKKILRSPDFLSVLRSHTSTDTGMFCVFSSGREEKIASLLQVPLLGIRKRCLHFGTKSGSREAFLATGVPHPQGTKLCYSKRELARELAALWRCLEARYKRLAARHLVPQDGETDAWRAFMPRKMVIKLDDAFSGEGNALLDFSALHELGRVEDDVELTDIIERQFADERTRFQAVEECWATFESKCESVGVLAEVFLDNGAAGNSDSGAEQVPGVTNPSGQACIDSDGQVHIMATHEQMMGGPDGQNYQGCVFPALATYRLLIQASVRKVGQFLAAQGALGHFSVDFLARRVDLARPGTALRLVAERHSTSDGGEGQDQSDVVEPNCAFDEDGFMWDLHALEINLRPGGATHPIMTLNLLTDGRYDETTGLYRLDDDSPHYAGLQSDDSRQRYYVASDNVKNPAFVGMTPTDIISLFEGHPLEFDGRRASGTIFHMLSCAREFGKLGMVCIGSSPDEARHFYNATFQRLLDARRSSP